MKKDSIKIISVSYNELLSSVVVLGILMEDDLYYWIEPSGRVI